jgi:hypothetical protein
MDLLPLLDAVSARVFASTCVATSSCWCRAHASLTHARRSTTPDRVLQCECLNADDSHPLRNALAEECRDDAGLLCSDVDEGTTLCARTMCTQPRRSYAAADAGGTSQSSSSSCASASS